MEGVYVEMLTPVTSDHEHRVMLQCCGQQHTFWMSAFVLHCLPSRKHLHAYSSAVCLKQEHCMHQLLCIGMVGVIHSRETRQATQVTQTNDANTG